jgi:RNA polymerase sigma-70 factor (ECF subfamily)
LSEKKELARVIKSVQDGNLEAFGLIYDRFFDSVYAYVLRQVGVPADAEDITAGVFLDVFERIDGFVWRGAGFTAWLFQIARNDVLDYFRKRRSPRNEMAISEEIEAMPAALMVEDVAQKKWDDRELRDAIDLLSDDQRQVVLLRLMLNFSHRQIGEVLDKSEGAIKALQHRAYASLRKILVDVDKEKVSTVA